MLLVLLDCLAIHERIVIRCGGGRVGEIQTVKSVGPEMVIQESAAITKEFGSRNMHDALFVEMRDKFIPISKSGAHISAKILLGHGECCVKTFEEGAMVTDNPLPMMLALAIGKQLAPVENRNVKGISVRANPELTPNAQLTMLPACPVERDVAQAVTAEKCDATNMLRVFHATERRT